MRPRSNGLLAARIPVARLDATEGMAHDAPAALWLRFAAGIECAAARS